ncbi:minor tail protein [Gordonia phage Zarbodnamra]|nr:minor tail protein [Gordonia phage Zarbodnamra]
MADITYMTVTGLWTHIVDDGIVDGDPNPDTVRPTGKVVFAPKPSNTGFVTAGAAGASESVTLAEVPALVADGVLTDLQGNDGIRLAATIGGNPVRWVAQPTLLYGKKTLPSKSVTFDPPTVGTTLHLNDLFDDIGPQSPLVTTEVKAYRDQAVAARDEAQQIVQNVDETVAEAAASAAADAVSADIAGRDLVQRADPGIPVSKTLSVQYLSAILGLRDELVFGVKSDGAVQIPIAEVAGGRTMQIPAEGLSWAALIDAAGRIGELCLDNSGQVPAWVLARWATRMGLTGSDPAVSTWPLDIVIVAGQSNATQRSTLAATVEPSTDSVVEWNGSAFVPAAGVPWLGSGFARDYALVHGRPRRRRVAIVKAALGSTGFTSTDPGTWDRTITTGATAYLYPEMIAKAQAALAAAPAGSQIVAMLWSQGEQDRTIAATTYQAKLDDLITQARIDLGISDLPVIVGSVSPDWIKYLESQSSPDYRGAAINNILEDTPRRVQRTAFVPGPSSMSEPETGIHWTPQGQALRGIAMAKVGLDTARLNLPTSAPMPPQNLRVIRSGTEVVVEWDHPPTRITSYTIEVSTDLGAVWTAMTLDRPTAHRVTGSVAAATPVWVRGTGTNETGTSMISREVHA